MSMSMHMFARVCCECESVRARESLFFAGLSRYDNKNKEMGISSC